jgi:pimeloyl-ACP methyl ester carboxylesterase
MADDLLAGLRQHDLTDVIAVGHSLGGVTSTLAAITEPERFRALVLLDPTFLPPVFLTAIRLLRAAGQSHRFPLAKGALRRRARFASVEEAFDYWQTKPLLANWPSETIRLYSEGMTRPSNNGGGVTLAWPPRWEAQIYQTTFTDWQLEIPRLRGLMPVLVLQGTKTHTFTRTSLRIMKRLLPEATYASIEGHGHLFPQSAPNETRRIVESWLETQIGRTIQG